jgi:acyl-homoserine lactone acylase PvdQ
VRRLVLLGLVVLAALPAPAAAQLPPLPPLPTPPPNPLTPAGPPAFEQAYGTNDGGGFRDVLPSGTRGLYNALELGAFIATGQTVPHCCEQLGMYGDLVYATPGLQAAQIPRFYKDSTFGVRSEDVERRYQPREDVVIVRDKGFGVPHVYGATRDGAMFGLGYAGAEDRLFFMDVLRHAGRGELAGFAGGSNAAMDREQWEVAPYTEADLTRQAEQLDDVLGPAGAQIQRDVQNYIAGINAYITQAKLNPLMMPGEYAAIGRPQGPDPWKPEDLIATASLVGGIFGKGGGEELEFSQVADALQKRFGRARGLEIFRDFRSAEDPEAPLTVLRGRFPYQEPPDKVTPGSVARPDPGSLKRHDVVAAHTGATPPPVGGLPLPTGMSNALLISGRESASGHPLFVAGPQVGYFNPQILMEQDVHAPAGGGQPGIDATGASFVGINLYVQLGRGRDYSWSATSAGQDNIDTFAVDLCGGDDTHYRFRGQCLPMEKLEKTVAWTPTPGDQTPPGSQTLRAYRTKLGLLAGYGTVRGRRVAFVKLRSTYFHEVDSAAGFMAFNDPAQVRDPASFQRAADKIGYTFNWFYADADHIAYYNSGANPVRAKGIDHDFPVRGRYEWRDWNPDAWSARFTPLAQHPQVTDQRYLISWNNKQAHGYASADANAFSSTYRSVLLEDRAKAAIAGSRKLTLPRAIDVMEMAGSTDLRAHVDLPLALRILGRPRDPALRAAVAKLRAWRDDGGLRRDQSHDDVYEHSDAVAIMDAWWPRWVRAQFEPGMGRAAFERLTGTVAIDNTPNGGGDHHGSAYQGSFYGYVSKDLRTVLGENVRGRYAREWCGGGRLARCRAALERSLRAALEVDREDLYPADKACKAGDQWCFDAIQQRPVGGATQPLIHWINRPTFQQVNEIQRHVGR